MGTTPIALLSSAEIPREQLTAFLRKAGVEQLVSAHRIFDYLLKRDNASLWIDLDDPENYADPETDAQIERKLGGKPHTRVMLQREQEPRAERLAMEFIREFAKQWPAVVDNLSGYARRVYSAQEVEALLRQGKGLREDDQTVPRPKYPDEDQVFIPRRREKHLPPEA